MLVKLLREYLRPYKRPIALIVVLQFLATLAMLYLPTLNADIIDTGVLTGNSGYIWRTGGLMLAITLGQIACQIGADTVITKNISTSICTCCTSFVLRVISEGVPKWPTSRAE